ncbi:MAG TPA: hypothetical protein VKG44_06650 [Candidatus Baltobacteraceae bacterium]|nr:hypothetical protein [Candidatus Baltobacteraceae bacterium]
MPPQKIMLVRHAEKSMGAAPPFGINEDGVQDKHSLTARGWQRAGALVPFFTAPDTTKGLETPTAIYAAAVGGAAMSTLGDDVSNSLRPQQTATPLARKLALALDTRFPLGEEAALARDILGRDGVVLVAWEHKHIPAIASALGANAPSAWPDERFDVVWVLDRRADGSYGFLEIDQALLDGDAQNP